MNASPDIVAEVPVADAPHRLSDCQVNTIHTAAYQLSERGRYDQACALFALLNLYRPKEAKYAHAVGVCFRKMGNYDQAIRFFAKAMELNPDDYGPAFQLIECMMVMGRREQAVEVLQFIMQASGPGSQDPSAERASALLAIIRSHQP